MTATISPTTATPCGCLFFPLCGHAAAAPPPSPREVTHAGPAPRPAARPRRATPSPVMPVSARPLPPATETGITATGLGVPEDLDPDELMRVLSDALAEHARISFAEFFRQAWLVLEPSTELIWNWHLQLICNVLQAVFLDWLRTKREPGYVNQVHNVIINVPPGSSKSRIVAVCFQAWVWLHWPGFKVLALSVNDDATMRDARAMRDLVRSSWYVELYAGNSTYSPREDNSPLGLKGDQDAISSFANTIGGDRISMPIKSEIVGLRADGVLADDPNNPQKSESQNERDEINGLWDTNQYNRVNDLARSLHIMVQQRTHIADATGHAIDLQGTWSPTNRNGWLWMVLPAEFDPERRFAMPECLVAILRDLLPPDEHVFADPRREKGETLDAIRLSPDVLAGERERWKGTNNYVGQMDQSPARPEGQIVQAQWFNFFRLGRGVRDDVDELDTGRPRHPKCHEGEAQVIHADVLRPGHWEFDWITLSVDPAAKKTTKGSNWGLLMWAGRGGRRYLLDDRTRRGALHEIIDVIKEMIRQWHPDRILIEPKAAGPDVMDTLLLEMADGELPMITIEEAEPGNDDKQMRLEACLRYIKNGMVFVLDGATWLVEYIDELITFPQGLRDDRVDATSQLLNWEREGGTGAYPDY